MIYSLEEDFGQAISDKTLDTSLIPAFGTEISEAVTKRFTPRKEERKPELYMSNVGKPCKRSLWYEINKPTNKGLPPEAEFKFAYGDLIESLAITLIKSTKHVVTHEQHASEILGVRGRCDCVIDGMLIDVKSASSASFQKFKQHKLRTEDPFGYLSQLSSYLYAMQDIVDYKDEAGFFAIDKVTGDWCLDVYNLRDMVDAKEAEIKETQRIVNQPEPPERPYVDKPYGKSGNRALPFECSFCNHKETCWPTLRSFAYAGSHGKERIVHFSKINREPNNGPREV